MVDMVTVSAWSEAEGMSRQAGYKAVSRCQIPVVDGRVDPDIASMLYRKRTRPRANEKRGGGAGETVAPGREDGGGEYWASRSRRESAEADMAEMKLAELTGELVRAADVRAAHAKRLAALRDSLLQIPARLAAVMAAETDQLKCHDALQRELHSVLAQVVGA